MFKSIILFGIFGVLLGQGYRPGQNPSPLQYPSALQYPQYQYQYKYPQQQSKRPQPNQQQSEQPDFSQLITYLKEHVGFLLELQNILGVTQTATSVPQKIATTQVMDYRTSEEIIETSNAVTTATTEEIEETSTPISSTTTPLMFFFR
ncbi:hypothetical protein SNEBB_000444 [Seison nebaliae]|nr:hypothetical protein SNEBB_000444 [Seison nebaliae]